MAASSQVHHIHHHFVYYFDSEKAPQEQNDSPLLEHLASSSHWRSQSVDLVHSSGSEVENSAFPSLEGQLKTLDRFVFYRLVLKEEGPILEQYSDAQDPVPQKVSKLSGVLITRCELNSAPSLTLYPTAGTPLSLSFADAVDRRTWERALTVASKWMTEGGEHLVQGQPLGHSEDEDHQHHHVFHRQHRDGEGFSEEMMREESEFIRQSEGNMRASQATSQEQNVRFVHHVYRLYQNVSELQQSGGLTDVAALRQHLRWALRVELSAIPPYLFAMYSIVDKESHGYKLLKSIAVEEMLHVSLAANLLTAVGGVPVFYNPAAMVTYPLQVPHHRDLQLQLEPLSEHSLDSQFLKLEQPCRAEVRSMRASQVFPEQTGEYETIGEMYRAIEGAFERLSRDESVDLFANPRVHLQMKPHNYKNVKHTVEESGGLMPVTDLKSARSAIATIMHQGEGVDDRMYADPGGQQLTHFYKLQLIRQEFEKHVGSVYPCISNPKTSQFSEDLQVVSQLFNSAYAALMLTIQELYQEEDVRGQLHIRSYALMEACLRTAGQILCQSPAHPGSTEHAGPTFEPFVFEPGQEPLAVVKSFAEQVIKLFPAETEKLRKGLPKI